jgi:hypothetical protein
LSFCKLCARNADGLGGDMNRIKLPIRADPRHPRLPVRPVCLSNIHEQVKNLLHDGEH